MYFEYLYFIEVGAQYGKKRNSFAIRDTSDADGNEHFFIDVDSATPDAHAEMQAGRVY